MSLALLVVSITLSAGWFPGWITNFQDIAPNFAGYFTCLNNSTAISRQTGDMEDDLEASWLVEPLQESQIDFEKAIQSFAQYIKDKPH